MLRSEDSSKNNSRFGVEGDRIISTRRKKTGLRRTKGRSKRRQDEQRSHRAQHFNRNTTPTQHHGHGTRIVNRVNQTKEELLCQQLDGIQCPRRCTLSTHLVCRARPLDGMVRILSQCDWTAIHPDGVVRHGHVGQSRGALDQPRNRLFRKNHRTVVRCKLLL